MFKPGEPVPHPFGAWLRGGPRALRHPGADGPQASPSDATPILLFLRHRRSKKKDKDTPSLASSSLTETSQAATLMSTHAMNMGLYTINLGTTKVRPHRILAQHDHICNPRASGSTPATLSSCPSFRSSSSSSRILRPSSATTRASATFRTSILKSATPSTSPS